MHSLCYALLVLSCSPDAIVPMGWGTIPPLLKRQRANGNTILEPGFLDDFIGFTIRNQDTFSGNDSTPFYWKQQLASELWVCGEVHDNLTFLLV